ncbi:MAG: RimK family alpha-L-glutamate ligase [Candidatus Acidiferrales bacterium]
MSNAAGGNGKEHGEGKPLAIYYEQQHWFKPLFEQLDARGVNWVRVDARNHQYDVAAMEREYSLLFNRMSPSAWQRGAGHGIFYTLNYLSHLEEKGVRVVNGSRAFAHEISKALQCTVLETLGLQYPKARVINHPSQALSAAEAIGYPLILKPNIGGSGAGIKKFNSPDELRGAVEENSLSFGIDNTALVQEFFTARDGVITRVEVLGGEYLYAIQIHITGDTFDLCPADICKNTKGEELTRLACPVDAPKSGLTVEAYEPPRHVIDDVERIMEVAGIEVGGIEYVIDERTGRLLYYDINSLSNFVSDPERMIGFNPYSRLADYLISEARIHEASRSGGFVPTGSIR